MSIGSFSKQPAESFPITVDFGPRMKTGEAVDTFAAVATNPDAAGTPEDPTDVTDLVIDLVNSTQAQDIVTLYVLGGSDGQEIKITVSVTTDSLPPNTYEADIKMLVREN